MAMFGSRYRRLSVSRSRELDGGRIELIGGIEGEPPLILNADEYRLAQLFDGARSAAAVNAEAAKQFTPVPNAAQIEAYAAELAVHGLLEPGYAEALPSPTVTEPQIDIAGARFDSGPLLASTLPGSLAGPGLMDGLLGIVVDERGRQRPLLHALGAAPWLAIGSVLNWPLRNAASLTAFVLLAAAAVYGVVHHYLDAGDSLLLMLQPARWPLLVLFSFVAVQVFGTAARAAAIRQQAGVEPVIGFIRGPLGIPLLHVDTGGAAERAPRPQRMRIVGAGLTSMAALAIGAALIWMMSWRVRPLLAGLSIVVSLIATIALLLRANPLVRRDGYFLLAQHFGIPDLREQAGASWFNYFRRGWVGQQRVLSSSTLLTYWALVIAFIVLVLFLFSRVAALLLDRYRGPGFVILLVVMGVIVSQTFRNSREGTNLDLGKLPGKSWYVRWAALLVAVAVISVIPYRYDPSGDLLVLPGDRADVRALIAGDVREVLVKEGDLVKAGDVLAKISDDEERAQVAVAQAKLAQAKADLALAKKGSKAEEIQVAESAVDTARQRAEVSAQQAQRLATAYRHNSVTAQEYERARGQAEVDQKTLVETQSKLDLVRSGADAERLDALEAQMHEAAATLAYARQQLTYTEIKAPIAGRVVSGTLLFARGSYLNRGDQLAVIEDAQLRLAEVKLPESSIDQVRDGSHAWGKVWAFPNGTFDGKVRSIAPSAEVGPYGKIVRVQLELQDPDHQLLPGMTGNAKVAGHWYPAIFVFSRALLRFLFVEVWSWIP
ncbi:HlyD family secretion protein [Solimonas terrae]|uniref:HlyD family efflux transporter periplasmic adaptor subunit n=1 Tax=Solimonas terrae TaxID=1396819 RepID=A0A6M2BS05_9GAMM|nr:efflux RND transporter periplasmic adaptor subunit [Solimonas terrae]NGY05268.1 HlyD family efflux transporter periplasmic adaptor subunit [Solimonas terrae]